MMRRRFGTSVRGRDTRITVTKPTVTYNSDGIEVISTNTTLSFWGDVKETQDVGGISGFKRLDAGTIAIEVDSESTATVSILDTLTTDRGPEVYEVVDKYDSEWKFTAMIIAKHKN